MKHFLIVAGLLLATQCAYATGASQNCNGNGSCSSDVTNNTTNAGGQANAAAVANANSTSVNKNNNVNKNANAQQQGQTQGQAIVGSGNSTVGNVVKTENANNASQDVVVEGDTYKERRNPVSTAYAPSIAPTANCALSVSAGVQVIGFGGSFGKAYVDENCAALERIRSVATVLNDVSTAEAMMCQDSAYAKARMTAGRPCAVEQE